MTDAAMPQHLPGVLHSLEPTLNHFGYLAVVGLVLIEDFGFPVHGETVLILAAVYAGTGRLNIVLVALLGFCSCRRRARPCASEESRLAMDSPPTSGKSPTALLTDAPSPPRCDRRPSPSPR
jgi:hypothetical protein